MKIVSYRFHGTTGFGVIEGNEIRPLGSGEQVQRDLAATLQDLAMGQVPRFETTKTIALDAVELLPPVPNPGKVICVATNFHEPARAGKPDPKYPLMFTRFAESITGHMAPLRKPAVSEKFDFEGELSVIIGKPGHKIPRKDAMSHVAGYSCFNDGSTRDWQKHSSQFTPGKNFFQSASLGPWLVTCDDIPDPATLTLETRVNGVTKQSIALKNMIFDAAWLIEYISTFTPLNPGDVIATGTPSGFGSTRKPPEFLTPGDRIDVTVSQVGTLSNIVVQDSDTRGVNFS